MGRKFWKSKRGIVGIEAAIVMIAFVVIAAAFAFMVVNMGLLSTQRSQEAIQGGLKEASCPLLIDGSILLKSEKANDVRYVIIPLKVLGNKYVPMWKNETIVSMKVGSKSALANMYAGINPNVDPTGMSFDEIITRLTTVNETVTFDSNGEATLSSAPVKPNTVKIIIDTDDDGTYETYSDDGKGTIDSATINYKTGKITNMVWAGKTAIVYYEVIQNYATVVGEKDDAKLIDTEPDGKNDAAVFSLDNKPVVPGSVSITLTYNDGSSDRTATLRDDGGGTLEVFSDTGESEIVTIDTANPGSINYTSGQVTINFAVGTGTLSSASALTNYEYVVNNFAKLVVENNDGDDSLAFYEKGYLIIILDASHNLQPRDSVVIEIRPEKSAPLTISFTVPEAIPANSYVTLE